MTQFPNDRLKAFTDGVFAIIITLLVLELRLESNELTLASLLHLIPKFMSYVIAFLMLAIFWINHSVLFKYVMYVDKKLLWLTILFILTLSWFPFSANLLGNYPESEISIFIFSANTLISTEVLVYTTNYVNRHHLVRDTVIMRNNTIKIRYTLLFLALITVFFSVDIAKTCLTLTPLSVYFHKQKLQKLKTLWKHK